MADTPLPNADDLFGATQPEAPTPSADALFPDPSVQEKPSQGLLDRLNSFTKPVQESFGRIWDTANEGAGSEPGGWSPENIKHMQDWGLLSDPANGKTGPLRYFNDALVKGFGFIGDGVVRVTAGAAYGLGQAAKETILATGGIDPTRTAASEADAAKGEIINFTNYIMAELMGRGGRFSRPEISPEGKPYDLHISLPYTKEFSDAAHVVISPEAAPIVRKIYEDKGFTPAEVAHDATTNPTIAQDLALGQMPAAYGGPKPTELPVVDVARINDIAAMRGQFKASDFTAADSIKRAYDGTVPDGVTATDIKEKLVSHGYTEGQAQELANKFAVEKPTTINPNELVPAVKGPDGKVYVGQRGQLHTDVIADNKLANPEEPGATRKLIDEGYVGGFATKDGTFYTRPEASKLVEGKYGSLDAIELNGKQDGAPPVEPPKPPETAAAADGTPPEPMTVKEAYQAINDKISTTPADSGPVTFDQLYTKFVDDLNPINVATKDALKALGMGKPDAANNPYSLFRLVRGIYGKADQFLLNSTFDFHTYKNNGPSLQAVLKPINKDLTRFRAYIAAKRAIELNDRGIDPGMSLEAARTIMKDDASVAKFEAAQRGLVEYQNRVAAYVRDSGLISEDAYQAMLDANQEYVPFFRFMEEAQNLKQLSRAGNTKGLSSRNPFVKIEGSDLPIIDPLESVIKNTYTYLALAEKNAAGLKLVDLLSEAGMIERITTKAEDAATRRILQDQGFESPALADAILSHRSDTKLGNSITVFRDGKKEVYTSLDPELLSAWRALDSQSVDILTKIFAVPASSLRAGVTLVPEFIAKNAMRDFFTAMVNVTGSVYHPINTAYGFAAILSKNADYQSWLKGGGANSAIVSMDRAYIQERLFKLHEDQTIGNKAWNVVKSPLLLARMASELAENSTRVGTHIKQLGDLGKDGATATKAEIQNAAFTSREATLDFARIGSKMRAYNMIVAFGNPSVQGFDRMVRAMKDNPYSTSAKVVGGITVPSLLLWWANKDDPRVQELPHWQRDAFWIIPTDDWQPANAGELSTTSGAYTRLNNGRIEINRGTIWRVPKPIGIGILAGSLPERIMDALYKDDPRAFDGFIGDLQEQLVPPFVPTAGIPFYQDWANKNTFTGGPVVPGYLESQLPEYQYTPYTTESAKALSRIFLAVPTMREASADKTNRFNGVASAIGSPIMLENYVRAWTGGTGMYALKLADWAGEGLGVFDKPQEAASTLADIPFIGAFVARYPSASAQSIQTFYDRNAVNKQVMNTFQASANSGDLEAVRAIQKNYGLRYNMDGLEQTLASQTAIIRALNSNPNMKPFEKRQLIDSAYFTMIELAHMGNKMLDEAEKSLSSVKLQSQPSLPITQ